MRTRWGLHGSIAGAVLAAALAVTTTASARADAAAAASAPLRADTRIAGDALLRDIALLERAYLQLHPGLYRYATPSEVGARFAALRAELGSGATLAQAYVAFSRFAASVKCGHTYANFYNQSKAVRAALLDSPTRVPFHFRWLDGRMIVVRDLTGAGLLPPGTEVLSIDGVATTALLPAMLAIARADGNNDAKRLRNVEVLGDDEYEAFDVFLPLLFPQVDAEQELRVRAPGDAQARTLRVRALTQAQRNAARTDLATDKAAAPWTLHPLPGGAMRIDMPTWAFYGDGAWDWQAWLAATLARPEVAAAPALVLDLRRNEGGVDVGVALLGHLSDAAFTLPGYVRKTRYRSTPRDLRPFLDTWDPSFHERGDTVTPAGDGFYLLRREDEPASGEAIAPRLPRYRGRVYALVGANNSSATFQFAQALKQADLGTLVGQPTGGNLRGINGGAFFFLRLPGSGIELDLPLVATFPDTPQPDAGVQPDIPVAVMVEDIATGRDPELAAALADLAARDAR